MFDTVLIAFTPPYSLCLHDYLSFIIIYYIFIICFEIGKFRATACLTYWQIESFIIWVRVMRIARLIWEFVRNTLHSCDRIWCLLWGGIKYLSAVTYNIDTHPFHKFYSFSKYLLNFYNWNDHQRNFKYSETIRKFTIYSIIITPFIKTVFSRFILQLDKSDRQSSR